jgi:HAD superfamily hydrolase (TIGR01509 family)
MVAIIDIDGTLVDSNYLHTICWQKALREHGSEVEAWRIHRHVGLGGDKMVAALAGQEIEDSSGDAIRSTQSDLFSPLIEEVQPLDGAVELLASLRSREHEIVLASSARPEEVEHYVDLLGAREIVNAWTTAGDVENTKPSPELVLTALGLVDGNASEAWMIGDAVWDVESASRSGVPTLGVLTGGYSRDELMRAGCAGVFESVLELAREIGATALA